MQIYSHICVFSATTAKSPKYHVIENVQITVFKIVLYPLAGLFPLEDQNNKTKKFILWDV